MMVRINMLDCFIPTMLALYGKVFTDLILNIDVFRGLQWLSTLIWTYLEMIICNRVSFGMFILAIGYAF